MKTMNHQYAVYVLASQRRGSIYIGVTNHLVRRVWEHKQKTVDGFTQRYGISLLVWYELHTDIVQAIKREKQLKQWKRQWKVNLIETKNKEWRDLWEDLI